MTATALSTTGNDRIKPGGNMPPEAVIFGEIDAFYDEAKNWASDGFKIENQEQADKVDELDKALLKAGQEADALRIEEKRPHDEAAQAVQDKYNPYVQKGKGKVDIARSTLKQLLTAWRVEQQRIADEKARKAREAAEAERRAAEEAMRASAGDLEAREQAEQQLVAAKQAEKFAKKADKAATVGTGLRTKWVAVMVDQRAAVAAMWKRDPQSFVDLAQTLAQQAAHSGVREIEGFNITEQKVAI